jgi:hypothetical protein
VDWISLNDLVSYIAARQSAMYRTQFEIFLSTELRHAFSVRSQIVLANHDLSVILNGAH